MVSIYFTQGKFNTVKFGNSLFLCVSTAVLPTTTFTGFCVFNLQMLCTVIVFFSVKLHLNGNSFIQLLTCIPGN